MRRAPRALAPGACLLLALAAPSGAHGQLAPAHLRTRWAARVSADNVLPEYPRPQMVRPRWTNLDGRWQYAVTPRTTAAPVHFDGSILVPFPLESQLGGVQRALTEDQRLWYRRTFRAPALRAGERLLLHFGAVDWEAVVSVNGREVGTHRGGYDPFTFDITSALKAGRDQELQVAVWDPTDKGDQPRGKQVQRPHSIWYTSVSGIWQTVWLEVVPRTYVSALEIVPDVDAGAVHVRVTTSGSPATGSIARLEVLDGARVVARVAGAADSLLTARVPDAKLWSPDRPFLYGLRVRLSTGDSVASYFGMRKIAVARDSAGILRLFLNGAPLFQFGLLDQGWWPDGLYTAPTDSALIFDIQTMKRLGFNLARKHVKVEPARWYYHCDRLGLLVWQDMPSADSKTAAGRAEFADELHRVVDALRNHPSIVMWVPFNEGWGQHDTGRYVDWLHAHDPSRLVDNASGWTDEGVGDVQDIHVYPGPAAPAPDGRRASVLGEFGGLGLPLAGHTWVDRDNWGYRRYTTEQQLGDAYRALLRQLRLLVAGGLSAAVYTQTTDVEVEVNGAMTYDRAVVKLPADAAALADALHHDLPTIRSLLRPSRDSIVSWRYTTEAPPASWTQPGFADSSWRTGPGGFGSGELENARPNSAWTTPDLWLRRTFDVGDRVPRHPYLVVYHDDDAEVYVNGIRAATLDGYTTGYMELPLDSAGVRALHAGGNTIAVHVHNVKGPQFIDVGLIDAVERR